MCLIFQENRGWRAYKRVAYKKKSTTKSRFVLNSGSDFIHLQFHAQGKWPGFMLVIFLISELGRVFS